MFENDFWNDSKQDMAEDYIKYIRNMSVDSFIDKINKKR